MTNTTNTAPETREEFHPTVLSQAFPVIVPSSPVYLWYSMLQQQQQMQFDPTFAVYAKPIECLSPDTYHEYDPAVLPIGAPGMAVHDLLPGPNIDMLQTARPTKSIIKDDVFLAQPSILSRDALYPAIDTDDTVSLSSHSSSSSASQHEENSTLSPVTSPTNFLYNHEPLFEGSIIEEADIDNSALPSSIVMGQPSAAIRHLSSSNDIDWFKLLDAFHADVACDLSKNDVDDHSDFLSSSSLSSAEDISSIDEPLSTVETIVTNKKRPRKITKKPASSKKRKLTAKKSTKKLDSDDYQLMYENKGATMFQLLTAAEIDWCRYCGTTEDTCWKKGPWGKRTLCSKHGAKSKLDLSSFRNEPLNHRLRPIVQEFCVVCQLPEKQEDKLIVCEGGCPRAYHQHCHPPHIELKTDSDVRWYCSASCKENRELNKVVTHLPCKSMPFMPKA